MTPSRPTRLVLALTLLATALFAPLAEAKCPKSAVGVWSGMLQLDSFRSEGGYNDKGVAVGRLVFAAAGTYQANFFSRNSAETAGQEVPISGTYSFSATTCSGQIDLGGNDYSFVITDSGRIMMGSLFNSDDSGENDVAVFTLYRE